MRRHGEGRSVREPGHSPGGEKPRRPKPVHRIGLVVAWLGALLASAAAAGTGTPVSLGPVEDVVAGLGDSGLGRLAAEVIGNSPELAALRAQAQAAAQRAPQVGSLPDPTASLTAYLLTPETRVGPQRAVVSLAQRLPWFGKLGLREQVALEASVAARSRVEAKALQLVTETRRLFIELAFLGAWEQAVHLDRDTLSHYETLARARYASGVGLDQAVVKIQAEITRDDSRLLDIAARRATLVAALNDLRAAPRDAALPDPDLPAVTKLGLDVDVLLSQALQRRPELAGADAEIRGAALRIDLAKKEREPDVTLGLTYALVGRRDDPAGRASPPTDNGQDVLGISGAVTLPLWHARITAGIEEAAATRLAAESTRKAVENRIAAALSDLSQRIGLTGQQVHLFDRVLMVQAEQSLRSAESAYAAGTVNALDLLDAERLVLEVRTSSARARADHAIAIARLEGEIAAPLPVATAAEEATND